MTNNLELAQQVVEALSRYEGEVDKLTLSWGTERKHPSALPAAKSLAAELKRTEKKLEVARDALVMVKKVINYRDAILLGSDEHKQINQALAIIDGEE